MVLWVRIIVAMKFNQSWVHTFSYQKRHLYTVVAVHFRGLRFVFIWYFIPFCVNLAILIIYCPCFHQSSWKPGREWELLSRLSLSPNAFYRYVSSNLRPYFLCFISWLESQSQLFLARIIFKAWDRNRIGWKSYKCAHNPSFEYMHNSYIWRLWFISLLTNTKVVLFFFTFQRNIYPLLYFHLII